MTVVLPEGLTLAVLEWDREREVVLVTSTLWVRVGRLRDSVTALVSVTIIVLVLEVEGCSADIDIVLVAERSFVLDDELPKRDTDILFDDVKSAVVDLVGVGGGVMVGVCVGGSDGVGDQDVDRVGVGGGVIVGVFVGSWLGVSETDLEGRSAVREDDIVLVTDCSLE